MRAARWAVILCGAVSMGSVLVPPSSAAPADPGIGDVLLSAVGPEFRLVGEKSGILESLTRTFESNSARLVLDGFPVTNPPGVRQMFQVFSGDNTDFEVIDEPSLELAAWFVPAGFKLGDGFASLIFAARDHLFIFTLTTDPASSIEPVSFVLGLAEQQITAAGGPPPPDENGGELTDADKEIVALLPAAPPAEYGLTASATVTGKDELQATDGVQTAVVDFLNEHSTTAARVWSDDAGQLLGAVSVTRYPYDIFAAAALGEAARSKSSDVASTDALDDVSNVVSYTGRGAAADQVGTAFRRGDVFVLVLVTRTDAVPAARATALAADLTRATASGLRSGDSGSYEFPDTPSKLIGLGLSGAVVTAIACGSTAVARLRARRVRRRWMGGGRPSEVSTVDGFDASRAIALDRDARQLRHRGAIVAGTQLGAVNLSIVSLAGDFGWQGAIVAVIALFAGLLLTRWWQSRELGLLGAAAPPREFILPRPAGTLVGLVSLALLGFGVGYAVKGLRYVLLPPSLAQLKWSDQLELAPRTVGIVFGVGGFVVAILGGWLFRFARALSRSGTKRLLEVDDRQAALYLRSFHDDELLLPTIASARRPLFELFSLRGTDPFEESVAWELNSYGPVVAVGRPGRSLASLGAAREHLSDETWREQVASRMEEAGIIAIATGETAGLAWELEQVVTGGHLPKTFFVFPPVAPDDNGRRWDHTAASLVEAGHAVGPLPVPPALVHTVRIDADGTARVTYANRRDEATYRTAVDQTLDPEISAGPSP